MSDVTTFILEAIGALFLAVTGLGFIGVVIVAVYTIIQRFIEFLNQGEQK